MASPLIVRDLGICDYVSTLAAMQAFTETRSPATTDELWVLQHPPVFTLGLNGKREHLLAPGNIPVVKTDRGGQVTYHGPGQWVVYCLFDVRRAELGVRTLVSLLERSVIEILADYQIEGDTRPDAPGVYVEGRKLASLGLRIRRGCSYHGLSLNVAMDLAPFQRINPCGYPGLAMTQLKELGVNASLFAVKDLLLASMQRVMGYTVVKVESELPVG